jgi:type 1 fimbriae regulatory protein FimB/type 1 fimbriae regulatory protein FimE
MVKPSTVNRTVVTPLRRPNAELRTREYLMDAEVVRLMDAARGNRYGQRDALMILMAYRHGFRAAELVDHQLRYGQPRRSESQEGNAKHAPDHGR